METFINELGQFLKANAFAGGLGGLALSIILLAGLVYLFVRRNEVMTLTYGITMLSMVLFLILCILAMLVTSLYAISAQNSGERESSPRRHLAGLLLLIILCPVTYSAQGINYPGNSPVNNGGAGNARTDADNLFTRNNAAALTEIENEENGENTGRWRVTGEFHFVVYRYERRWTPTGFAQPVRSQDSIALPSASGEITYTARDRKFAFGVGLSQTFGFQSKLKDDEKILGSRAAFFDTRVVSNDVSVAGAARLHERLSIGGSFIFGRAFLVQTTPVAELAAIGIVRLNRLDVKEIGGMGASFNLHYRPTRELNFGFNLKTARRYDLQGALDTVQPVVGQSGLQLFPVKIPVRVPFRLPLIAETGIKYQPTAKMFVAVDYRFYNYSRAFKAFTVVDQASDSVIAAQPLDARNVHLVNIGGAFTINRTTRLLFGGGLTTNAFSDQAFTPALNNSGGYSFSGGLARRVSGIWMNVGVTAIFSGNRTIAADPRNPFPGSYRARGLTIAWGFRK